MRTERVFEGKETFRELFVPMVLMEMEKLLEAEPEMDYNKGNANTSHSEGVAKL